MAINDRSRYELYQRLESAIGSKSAEVLMEHLPPAGWADVVTKQHLDARLEATEYKLMAAFRGELASAITSQTRTLLFGLAGLHLTGATLVLAASRLNS